jgi:hypothetical protein
MKDLSKIRESVCDESSYEFPPIWVFKNWDKYGHKYILKRRKRRKPNHYHSNSKLSQH